MGTSADDSGETEMSGSGSTGDTFDVRRIRRLVELMNEFDLAEIDLRQENHRIRLRRGAEAPLLEAAPAPAAAPRAAAPAAPAAAPKPEPVAAADDKNIVAIKSPMVGTFYRSPSPEAGPFVKVGDHVGPESTVCVIEAMKVFNELPAECSGQIVAVLVENGEPVEFGQPLFRVDTSK
jgi:acetyl-CoA carboxylase biotin carboxyl carrier protein